VPAFLFVPLLFAAMTNTGTVPASHERAPRRALAACSAVTRTDVEQALGRPVAKGEESKEGPQSTCDYAGGRGQVTITVQHLTAKLDMRAEIASLQASIPEGTVREAAGVAASAFFLDIPGAGTQLYVIRGDTDFVLISVLGFGDATQVSAAAETLARKALGRI
jgi:hypothetical protein